MLYPLAVLLFFAPAASVLSSEAAEYNAKAMQYYDAGQLASAVDEFYAAYQSMPDPRRDLAGREQLLGSMRATLLDLHDQTGEAAPLCRLQGILQGHADALSAAYPNDPNKLEIRSARARHEEAAQQLARFGPDACKPPPAPAVAAVIPAGPSAPAPDPATPAGTEPPAALPPAATNPPADVIPPRHLRIAGGMTLGLSAALLGVMAYGITTEARQRAGVAAIKGNSPDCPLTTADYNNLQTYRQDALTGRRIATGTGIAAGITAALGTTLLVLAHRSARMQRLSAAPWWSPTGAGLTVHIRLGAAR